MNFDSDLLFLRDLHCCKAQTSFSSVTVNLIVQPHRTDQSHLDAAQLDPPEDFTQTCDYDWTDLCNNLHFLFIYLFVFSGFVCLMKANFRHCVKFAFVNLYLLIHWPFDARMEASAFSFISLLNVLKQRCPTFYKQGQIGQCEDVQGPIQHLKMKKMNYKSYIQQIYNYISV